mgnify:CR=1
MFDPVLSFQIQIVIEMCENGEISGCRTHKKGVNLGTPQVQGLIIRN